MKRLRKTANYKIVDRGPTNVTIDFPEDEARQFDFLFNNTIDEEFENQGNALDEYLKGKIEYLDTVSVKPEYEYFPKKEELSIFW